MNHKPCVGPMVKAISFLHQSCISDLILRISLGNGVCLFGVVAMKRGPDLQEILVGSTADSNWFWI
ncbi:MAG: hypothetical protein CMM47_10535 [Rhodospirillaceae bacterium]|nr:hypothetical protein [Rhodospirillaceae bacterium]